MNDEQLMNNLLCQILDCWYLDIKKLCDVCKHNCIDLDIEEIKANYWKLDLNTLIYESIKVVAEKFLWEYENEIKRILNLWEYDDLKEYCSYNEIYEIYCNYLDSHLWFKNDRIQSLFESSKYEI